MWRRLEFRALVRLSSQCCLAFMDPAKLSFSWSSSFSFSSLFVSCRFSLSRKINDACLPRSLCNFSEGQTTVTGGTSFKATCFRVTGEATNPASQPVYNADIFGRVYDAQGEPALDTTENLRIDTLAEIPPGKSKVSFQITVSEEQAKLGPLELKNFKATGYLGKVNSKQDPVVWMISISANWTVTKKNFATLCNL
ncbi:uncharacterized protein LOC9632160 isoform X2 [Selaginella moellendorffii]|uniref:uncharacterized protein LOC9632160 isoform X2 n=1 Tax=Selaginella moellendorffii TaxID=88036 RepID=UPI000D1C44B8|nr:uncharacterized protein LOC9632160 isoform X2 [Selaginella moellendorffii]|eukprot:XP_024531039.1 uncharacterized protein LOC9632160 isoform X2 [Selaginella moellendorffii]